MSSAVTTTTTTPDQYDDCQRVKVGLRIRPLGDKELLKGAQSILNVKPNNRKSVHCSIPSRQNTFNFDWAFGQNDNQSIVYNELCSPIIEPLFNGINATILAC